jgi:hypothetical protein
MEANYKNNGLVEISSLKKKYFVGMRKDAWIER